MTVSGVQSVNKQVSIEGTDLVDADLCLHVLQALLNDGDEGSRGHQGSVDIGLADVALYAKGESRVGEAWQTGRGMERGTLVLLHPRPSNRHTTASLGCYGYFHLEEFILSGQNLLKLCHSDIISTCVWSVTSFQPASPAV